MGHFTVQISGSLIDRLVGDGEKEKETSKKKTKRSKPKVPREPENPQPNASERQSLYDFEKPKTGGDPDSVSLPTSPALEFSKLELEAVPSVLHDSEKVVERLQKQEENMLQEVTGKAKDLRDKEYKPPNSKQILCMAERDASLACYKEHSEDPLKCAGLVTNFADCLRRVRQQINLS